MPRVKGGMRHAQHRKNILRHAKGFRCGRKSKIKLAKVAVARKFRYALESRRLKKRAFRQQWLLKVNAALRAQGLKWSTFSPALKRAKISLNSKILADLAANHPAVFTRLIEIVKPHVSQKSITPA